MRGELLGRCEVCHKRVYLAKPHLSLDGRVWHAQCAPIRVAP